MISKDKINLQIKEQTGKEYKGQEKKNKKKLVNECMKIKKHTCLNQHTTTLTTNTIHRTTLISQQHLLQTGVDCVDAEGQVVEPTQCLLGKTMVPESSVECHVECSRPCVFSSWSAWTPCPSLPPCGTSSVRKRQLLGGWMCVDVFV